MFAKFSLFLYCKPPLSWIPSFTQFSQCGPGNPGWSRSLRLLEGQQGQNYFYNMNNVFMFQWPLNNVFCLLLCACMDVGPAFIILWVWEVKMSSGLSLHFGALPKDPVFSTELHPYHQRWLVHWTQSLSAWPLDTRSVVVSHCFNSHSWWDVEHLLICLFDIWIYFLVRCLLRSWSIFLIEWFVSLLLSYIVLCIF